MKLTAVSMKVSEGYIGFVEELPGANAQEATLQEARASRRQTVFVHRLHRTDAAVPRHNEINDYPVRKICRQLRIAEP